MSNEDWDAFVVRARNLIPFHPAGRNAYGKLINPSITDIETPALFGERALVEALARLNDPMSRWRWMYQESPGCEALFDNPSDLGADYAPDKIGGPQMDWRRLSEWGPETKTMFGRRLSHVVCVGIDSDLGVAMANAADVRGVRIATESPDWSSGVSATMGATSDRLVLIVEGDAAHEVIRLLHDNPVLRDRVLVVVSIAGLIGVNEEQRSWLSANFQHTEMDTELNRVTQYWSITVVDPDDPVSDDWNNQAFPVPHPSADGRSPISVENLGPIPGALLYGDNRTLLARALMVLLGFALS